ETLGQVSVRSLWRELGMSERYFTQLFRENIGVTPGRFAKLCRFDRLLERLTRRHSALADVALDVGYYDQSHMARDVRSFAAMAPAGLKTALNREWPLTEIVNGGDLSTVSEDESRHRS
ncbi:MAG: helix-turn-helix domain-containing protein, partial [Myxococcota bacterium]